jgi:hypothetical protein
MRVVEMVSEERGEPNGGVFYDAEYRERRSMIPSNAVRHVVRAAVEREARWGRLGRWLGVIGLSL